VAIRGLLVTMVGMRTSLMNCPSNFTIVTRYWLKAKSWTDSAERLVIVTQSSCVFLTDRSCGLNSRTLIPSEFVSLAEKAPPTERTRKIVDATILGILIIHIERRKSRGGEAVPRV